jgi:hypothetical protein
MNNGPWLAGYGLAFLRRADEPLEKRKTMLWKLGVIQSNDHSVLCCNLYLISFNV